MNLFSRRRKHECPRQPLTNSHLPCRESHADPGFCARCGRDLTGTGRDMPPRLHWIVTGEGPMP